MCKKASNRNFEVENHALKLTLTTMNKCMKSRYFHCYALISRHIAGHKSAPVRPHVEYFRSAYYLFVVLSDVIVYSVCVCVYLGSLHVPVPEVLVQ